MQPILRPNFPRLWVFWRCFLFLFFLKSQTIFLVFPIMLFSLKCYCDEKNKKRECWEENHVVSHTAVWLRTHPQREVFASCMLYVQWGNLLLTYTWHPVSISVKTWNPGHETGYYVSLWYCCVPVMLKFQWQGCGLLLTLATFKKDIFICIFASILPLIPMIWSYSSIFIQILHA